MTPPYILNRPPTPQPATLHTKKKKEVNINWLHLYSAFIQSAVQFMPLIHPFTHTFTHQRRLAAMQGTNQLVRSNWGFGVFFRDTSTRPGRDQTGNPLTARRLLLPPEPYRPYIRIDGGKKSCIHALLIKSISHNGKQVLFLCEKHVVYHTVSSCDLCASSLPEPSHGPWSVMPGGTRGGGERRGAWNVTTQQETHASGLRAAGWQAGKISPSTREKRERRFRRRCSASSRSEPPAPLLMSRRGIWAVEARPHREPKL